MANHISTCTWYDFSKYALNGTKLWYKSGAMLQNSRTTIVYAGCSRKINAVSTEVGILTTTGGSRVGSGGSDL